MLQAACTPIRNEAQATLHAGDTLVAPGATLTLARHINSDTMLKWPKEESSRSTYLQ